MRRAARRALGGVGCAALALVGSPMAAACQDLAMLAPGTRLRVNAQCDGCVRRIGEFVSYASDTLWLGPGARREAIPSREIISLEMLRRTDRAGGASKGILLGFLIGGGFGAALGAAGGGPTDSPGGKGTAESGAIIGLFLLGLFGAFVGAIVGASAGGEEWVPLPLPPVHGRR